VASAKLAAIIIFFILISPVNWLKTS